MKNDKPNYTEIENLSAYLDHELSEVQQQQLRDRLLHDVELRDRLEDLRLTRYTLRHTPNVRRQRGFTLSPEMVRKQKFAWQAMNFSRMVAAAASVLFALVLGGEVLFGGSMGMLASAPAENAAMVQDTADLEAPMAMESAVEEEMAEAPMEALAAEPEEEPAAEEPAADEPAVEESIAEAPAAEEPSDYADDAAEGVEPTPTLQATQSPAMAAEPQATQEPGGGGGAPPTETPMPTSPGPVEERTVPSEKVAEETMAIEEDIAAGTAMGDEHFEGEPIGQVGDGELAELAGSPEEVTARVPLIRWIQGGLLVLAIVSGVAAIFFRKSAR
jgi:hypothetical protein